MMDYGLFATNWVRAAIGLGITLIVSTWATACLALEPHALCNRELSKQELQQLAGEYQLGLGTSHIKSGDREVKLDFYLPLGPDFAIPISSKQVSSAAIVYRDEGREGRYANGDLYLAQPGGEGDSFRFLRGQFRTEEIVLRESMATVAHMMWRNRAETFYISERVAEALANSVEDNATGEDDEHAFRSNFGSAGVTRFKALMGCEGWEFPWFLIPGLSVSEEGQPIVFLYRLVLVNFEEDKAHFLGTLEWWGGFANNKGQDRRDIYQIRAVVFSKSG